MSTKDEIFDYVMNSPEDTNPSVLRSLLNNLETSASGPFIIEITYDYEEEYYFTDVSFNEIEEAFQQGRPLYCTLVNYTVHGEPGTLYPLFYWEPSDADTKVYFHCRWGEIYVSDWVNPYTESLAIEVTPYDEFYSEDHPEIWIPYLPKVDNENLRNKFLATNENGYWEVRDISDLTQ